MKEQLVTDLISEFSRLGITVNLDDVQTVLQMGAETFAMKRGYDLQEKSLTSLHLILNELRNN